jgi:hypothetical protein
MNTSNHKEFRVSYDGTFVAVGSVDKDVCVIRVADNRRFDLPGVSYDFGGHRLTVDPQSRTLFSGAYYNTGIAAYEIETGNRLWQRRDLKKLQEIGYDSRDDLVYCAFEGRAAKPLNARDGRERRPIRGLKGFHFSKDCGVVVLESAEVKLDNRAVGVSHTLPRQSWGVLDVAFAAEAVVLSWVGGPVVSYDAKTGQERWLYPTQGTHAYSIAPSTSESAVWVAEQPYEEPPWHRLRLLSDGGKVLREIRCALGHSFEVVPFCDKVIRADVAIVAIDTLGPQLTNVSS